MVTGFLKTRKITLALGCAVFCFLVRGWFYAAAFPLWEGFDEWAHFAVIERMAFHREVLPARASPISRAVEASLDLAPVPWDLRGQPPPSLTQDRYWRLPEQERSRREAAFRALPLAWNREPGARFTAYEALQPPLYYWICAPVLFLLRNHSLAMQVLVLRWFSVAIAAAAIPFAFRIGQAIFRSDGIALGCAAVIAVMPGFAIDTARIANDSLAVALFTILIYLLLAPVVRPLAIGITLGLALLAKVYALTAIPSIAILFLYNFLRNPKTRRLAAIDFAIIACSAALIAGWWYARNLVQTGTLTGLIEAIAFRAPASIPARLAEIHWMAAADAILFSHLWFGGWSSLTLRSYFYHCFYLLIALAAAGLLRLRRDPRILLLAAIYAGFWLGQFYFVWLLYARSGVSTSMGWYMYAVVAAEAPLSIAGLRALAPKSVKQFVVPVAVSAFAALDLFAMHAVALPYYSGLILHRDNGRLTSFHPADVHPGEVLARLASFKPLGAEGLAALWAAYLLATLGLAALAIFTSSGPRVPEPDRASTPRKSA